MAAIDCQNPALSPKRQNLCKTVRDIHIRGVLPEIGIIALIGFVVRNDEVAHLAPFTLYLIVIAFAQCRIHSPRGEQIEQLFQP